MPSADVPTGTVIPELQTGAPHVIAVTSGKGGVGKSSISVNLGIALSRMGRKVCIFDADTGLANINILLGVTPRLSLEHVLYGNKTITDVMIEGPHGLKVIPGANGIAECVKLDARQQMRLTSQLSGVEGDFDYLLVDTAAGISELTLDFVGAAQQTLIVVTPEPTSLTDAFSLIKLLRRRGKKNHFHVIVNMCSSTKQARDVFRRFYGAVDKYIGIKMNYLGFILQDESLRAAVTMQSPVALFPESDPSSRNFFRLGQALEDTLQPIPPVASFSAYWQSQYRRQHKGKTAAPVKPVRHLSPPEPAAGAADAAWPVKQRTPSGDNSARDMFNELRTRLLTLIAQGGVPEKELARLIGALNDAAQRLSLANHDNTPKSSSIPTTPIARGATPDPAPSVAAPVTPRANTRNSDTADHRFDEATLGPQALFVQLLRQHPDLPLGALLEKIRQDKANTTPARSN